MVSSVIASLSHLTAATVASLGDEGELAYPGYQESSE